MRSMLSGTTLALCLLCTAANAFFYLADPNYPLLPNQSRWPPILAIAVIYTLFGLLAWSRRGSTVSGLSILVLCALAAGLLVWGRGQEWYGSVTVPNYYNMAYRLGALFGGMAQVVCLAVASVAALLLHLLPRFHGSHG
jgi:hypothetical protein